jgi:hypothetical protein
MINSTIRKTGPAFDVKRSVVRAIREVARILPLRSDTGQARRGDRARTGQRDRYGCAGCCRPAFLTVKSDGPRGWAARPHQCARAGSQTPRHAVY